MHRISRWTGDLFMERSREPTGTMGVLYKCNTRLLSLDYTAWIGLWLDRVPALQSDPVENQESGVLGWS